MEANEEHKTYREEPLQYDEVREVMNTPPPSLIINTNLLIIAILLVGLSIIVFVKFPISYQPNIVFDELAKKDQFSPIVLEDTIKVNALYVKDRENIIESQPLLEVSTKNRTYEINAFANGQLIFAKALRENEIVPKATVIAWISMIKTVGDAVVFNVSLNDAQYFKIENQFEMSDKYSGVAQFKVVGVQYTDTNCNLSAKIIAISQDFDFVSAYTFLTVDEQTILERLLK